LKYAPATDDDDDTCYWGEILQIYQQHDAYAKYVLNGTFGT
jgi:hypothetical protein